MGTKWDRSNSMEWYGGSPAIGAKVYFYDAGTSTPRATYTTADLSTARTHPVVADGDGRWPAIFLQFGDYKETATTSGNTELWSTDNITNDEPFTDTFELDEDAIYNTGDLILSLKNGTRSGAVRCNGRTIGNAASGATERANADTADLFTFWYNSTTNSQAAVSGGRGANAAADYGANKTIALPDYRGASLVGFDDMGNTAAGLAASAPVVSGSAILAGSIIGENTHVLVTGELASHTHTGTTATEGSHTHSGTSGGANTNHTHTFTTGSESATHTHAFTFSGASYDNAGITSAVSSIAGTGLGFGVTTTTESATHTHSGTTATEAQIHTHDFTTGAGTAHSHTFTSAATGSGTAHNNLSRSIPVTILMKL